MTAGLGERARRVIRCGFWHEWGCSCLNDKVWRIKASLSRLDYIHLIGSSLVISNWKQKQIYLSNEGFPKFANAILESGANVRLTWEFYMIRSLDLFIHNLL